MCNGKYGQVILVRLMVFGLSGSAGQDLQKEMRGGQYGCCVQAYTNILILP